MSEQYANKLEIWFSSLPSLVQETLHEPFRWMNDGLKSVSGNPQELLAAAPQYLQIADTVSRLGREQLNDRNALTGRWSGDAFDAFSAQMDHINDQFNQLSHAIGQVQGLLESGAKACVDGANMIIDLVTSLIMFALGLIAVNVALAIITVGTSLAASVALVVARAAQTLAKVARVIEKVAEVLTKLANLFRKLHEILKKVTELLKQLETYLKEQKAAAKAAKGMDWARKTAVFTGKNAAVSQAIKYGTGGLVAPPGVGGSTYHGLREYGDGWIDAGDAGHAVQ
jgi:WXG100 family type VII secretion target